FAARLRAHRRRIRAGAGLRQRVGGEPLAARELRQEALLLLLRSRQLDPERAKLLHREDQPARGADLGDLLDRDQRHPGARAGAAVLEYERRRLHTQLVDDEFPSLAVMPGDYACDRLLPYIRPGDAHADRLADPEPPAAGRVVDLDPCRLDAQRITRLPRPREVLAHVAAERARENLPERLVLVCIAAL